MALLEIGNKTLCTEMLCYLADEIVELIRRLMTVRDLLKQSESNQILQFVNLYNERDYNKDLDV